MHQVYNRCQGFRYRPVRFEVILENRALSSKAELEQEIFMKQGLAARKADGMRRAGKTLDALEQRLRVEFHITRQPGIAEPAIEIASQEPDEHLAFA
jgi:hypothetical protein